MPCLAVSVDNPTVEAVRSPGDLEPLELVVDDPPLAGTIDESPAHHLERELGDRTVIKGLLGRPRLLPPIEADPMALETLEWAVMA